MANTVASRKAKGRRLQNAIVDSLYKYYPELREGDIRGAIMGENGRDIELSPVAEEYIPLDIEAKNVEKLNVWKAFEQAESNSKRERVPCLVFKRNRSNTYVMLKWEDLLELLS